MSIEDRSLIRTRDAFVGDVTRYKNRIKSFLMFHGIELPEQFQKNNWSKKFIDWLKAVKLNETTGNQSLESLIETYQKLREQVLKSTRQIHQLSKSERYNLLVRLLLSIPGIGIISAMSILTEIEDINRFRNNDHFCSFVGLTPGTHSSGEKEINTGITFRAHGCLREIFIEAAWVAVRKDPALLLSFQKYSKRMESNKAIIRIAKKLACRVQFVLRQSKPYECLIN